MGWTILKGGLRGANKGCKDLYGELHCPYCGSSRVKFEEQIGTRRTRWSCRDWEKWPHKHAYGYKFTYDRSDSREIQRRGGI